MSTELQQERAQTESAHADPGQSVVSVRFGELKLCGCENHPDRLDLSCAKIRQSDGTALNALQVWEVLKELAAGDTMERYQTCRAALEKIASPDWAFDEAAKIARQALRESQNEKADRSQPR